MMHPTFAYIWQYSINPERKDEFLAAYRTDGEWVKLFSKDRNYVRTELLQDSSDESVYVTIDYWTSKTARNAFRESFAEEFAALDEKCEAYAIKEIPIGDFIIVGADAG
jgi:heme-degrading monooxygenase HmoA